jgi:hypothetical protein
MKETCLLWHYITSCVGRRNVKCKALSPKKQYAAKARSAQEKAELYTVNMNCRVLRFIATRLNVHTFPLLALVNCYDRK